MSILVESKNYIVSGNVTLKECMNLSVLMRYANNVADAIKSLRVSEAGGEYSISKESGKSITEIVEPASLKTVDECINNFYKPIYYALHDDFVVDKGNKSAAYAQENSFRQAIVLALSVMLERKATIQLCTVLDTNDKMYTKADMVKSFKLYNSFNTVLGTEAEYERVVSKADFVLTVESV